MKNIKACQVFFSLHGSLTDRPTEPNILYNPSLKSISPHGVVLLLSSLLFVDIMRKKTGATCLPFLTELRVRIVK
jgi:hypothetical protein